MLNPTVFLRGLARFSRRYALRSTLAVSALALAACSDPTAPAGDARGRSTNAVSALVVPVSGFRDLSAQTGTTCAVTATGGITCWGLLSSGSGVAPQDLTDAVSVSLGSSHGCAVRIGGQLTCWGALPENGAAYGQATVPPGLTGVTQVSTAAFYTCAVTLDQTVHCWGRSIRGESIVPAGLPAVTQVSTGFVHTCVLTAASTVICWGSNGGAEVVPPGLTGVTQVSASVAHTCALLGDGRVTCWGFDPDGRASVPAGLTDVTQISTGENNTCAVQRTGTVVCWGDNSIGQSTAPAGLSNAVRVSAGGFFTCALTSSGTVVCWGVNAYGQSTAPSTRVLPTATFVSPGSVSPGSAIVLALTGPQVVGAPGATQFTFAFDCGDGAGFGAASSNAMVACPTTATGARTVRGKVIDASGDFSVYSAAVEVLQTIRSLRVDVAASGIARSVRLDLIEALDAAQKASDRGRPRAVCLALREFNSEVRESRGGPIPVATADRWLASESQLRKENGC